MKLGTLESRNNNADNNMQTLKFKAQPTNSFFAAVNQMFSRRLLSASDYYRADGNPIFEHSSDKKQRTAVVRSWEEPPNI